MHAHVLRRSALAFGPAAVPPTTRPYCAPHLEVRAALCAATCQPTAANCVVRNTHLAVRVCALEKPTACVRSASAPCNTPTPTPTPGAAMLHGGADRDMASGLIAMPITVVHAEAANACPAHSSLRHCGNEFAAMEAVLRMASMAPRHTGLATSVRSCAAALLARTSVCQQHRPRLSHGCETHAGGWCGHHMHGRNTLTAHAQPAAAPHHMPAGPSDRHSNRARSLTHKLCGGGRNCQRPCGEH